MRKTTAARTLIPSLQAGRQVAPIQGCTEALNAVRRPQARATSTVFPARDADRAKKASEAPADPCAMTAKLPQHRDGAEARGFPSPPRRTASRA